MKTITQTVCATLLLLLPACRSSYTERGVYYLDQGSFNTTPATTNTVVVLDPIDLAATGSHERILPHLPGRFLRLGLSHLDADAPPFDAEVEVVIKDAKGNIIASQPCEPLSEWIASSSGGVMVAPGKLGYGRVYFTERLSGIDFSRVDGPVHVTVRVCSARPTVPTLVRVQFHNG